MGLIRQIEALFIQRSSYTNMNLLRQSGCRGPALFQNFALFFALSGARMSPLILVQVARRGVGIVPSVKHVNIVGYPMASMTQRQNIQVDLPQ
jgi:hypothetical protein